MKNCSFASFVTFFALLPTVIFPSVSYAQETTFFCGTEEGVPATIARTSQREVAMVLWSAEQLNQSDSSPEQLCQEVSQRFQTYYNQGKLNYITTGRVNRQNVACVAQAEGGSCNGFLFALNPEIKPKVALQRMFRIRVPSDGPINETGTPLYINLERYFNGEYPSTTPIDNNRSSKSQSEEMLGATYYFTVDLPEDAGVPLQQIALEQREGVEFLEWYHIDETRAFEGTRKDKGEKLSLGMVAADKEKQTVTISFDPPVPPGRKVTVGLRPVFTPKIGGVYLFRVTVFPPGEGGRGLTLGTARLQFYQGRR